MAIFYDFSDASIKLFCTLTYQKNSCLSNLFYSYTTFWAMWKYVDQGKVAKEEFVFIDPVHVHCKCKIAQKTIYVLRNAPLN